MTSAHKMRGRYDPVWDPTTIGERPEWQHLAACASEGKTTAMFFPTVGQDARPAYRICEGCPVKAECLAFALEHRITVGIWGGVSERQRRTMRPRLTALK